MPVQVLGSMIRVQTWERAGLAAFDCRRRTAELDLRDSSDGPGLGVAGPARQEQRGNEHQRPNDGPDHRAANRQRRHEGDEVAECRAGTSSSGGRRGGRSEASMPVRTPSTKATCSVRILSRKRLSSIPPQVRRPRQYEAAPILRRLSLDGYFSVDLGGIRDSSGAAPAARAPARCDRTGWGRRSSQSPGSRTLPAGSWRSNFMRK